MKTIHLLPNAHLDPVWLWDWREGLNEALSTTRTVLDLMDERPELTFIRGEAALYEHIEKTDPKLFDRILQKFSQGRWDIVGGTYIQPDTNLTGTEVLCRQFEYGLNYFQKRFNFSPRIAWLADSFGHSAGLPNIFSAFGMTGFAFTRPSQKTLPIDSPAFYWEGAAGTRILCYRQYRDGYCSERDKLGAILDETLQGGADSPLRHLGVLMGLGNHGGGPTRAHLAQVDEWRKMHPEVEVRFSTWHGFFECLEKDLRVQKLKIPGFRGELGFWARGCYSSVMRLKGAFRRAESLVSNAETCQALVPKRFTTTDSRLDEAWRALLFNSFHDILPGSSIERALDEQVEWIGRASHDARAVHFEALNQLAAQVDTCVLQPKGDRPTDAPVLLWNGLPRPFRGWVEVEVSLDYRPLWAYENCPSEVPVVVFGDRNQPLPFQQIRTEHSFLLTVPWRVRVAVEVQIPALGWTVVKVGYRDRCNEPPVSQCTARRGLLPAIGNQDWKIQLTKAGSVKILHHEKPFFAKEGAMKFRVYEDGWGSWGGVTEEPESYLLSHIAEEWKVSESAILEEGPYRAALWTRWSGKNSWMDLTFLIAEGDPTLEVRGRLLWNERSSRLKLVLPSSGKVLSDVPGGIESRNAKGHLSFGRWVVREGAGQSIGFASDTLSDMDFDDNELRITLARASRYADDGLLDRNQLKWLPAVDCGELKFNFRLFAGAASPDQVVDRIIQVPVALPVPASPGTLGSSGSLGSLKPDSLRLLALKKTDTNTYLVRIQNRGSRRVSATLRLGKRILSLGKLAAFEIKTFQCKA